MSVQRVLILMVKRYQSEKDNFSAAIPTALREYADAVEKGENGNNDHEVLETSNGCRIVVIGGGQTILK